MNNEVKEKFLYGKGIDSLEELEKEVYKIAEDLKVSVNNIEAFGLIKFYEDTNGNRSRVMDYEFYLLEEEG